MILVCICHNGSDLLAGCFVGIVFDLQFIHSAGNMMIVSDRVSII